MPENEIIFQSLKAILNQDATTTHSLMLAGLGISTMPITRYMTSKEGKYPDIFLGMILFVVTIVLSVIVAALGGDYEILCLFDNAFCLSLFDCACIIYIIGLASVVYLTYDSRRHSSGIKKGTPAAQNQQKVDNHS